jgi:hypothetical protein
MNIKDEIELIVAECEKIIELEAAATKRPWNPPSDNASHLVSPHSRNFGQQVCDFPDSTGDLSQFRRDRTLATHMRDFSAPAARAMLFVLKALPMDEVLIKHVQTEIVRQWRGE